MALIVNDRVRESTTVTGTGTATLLGAIAGYQAFSVIGNGNTCYYTIADQIGANWEVGIGTYTASGTTLARTTVLRSSNSNNLVSFTAGTKDVFVTYPAETSVSGGGGGTYPTIQPTLNLDFANTKLLDPRITFVRNSTAAYYDGQTSALAEQNLLLWSQDFSNAAWIKSTTTVTANTDVAPDGTLTASTITTTSNSIPSIRYSGTVLQNTAITISIFLKATSQRYILVASADGLNSFFVIVDTLNWVITDARSEGTGTYTSSSLVQYPNGFYRVIATGITRANSSAANPQARPCDTATSTTHNVSVTNSPTTYIVWGAQLEQRSSATAYTPTTTAAITNYIPVLMTAPAGVARFDCDPITGKSLGLLIEESRVNLLDFSSSFATSGGVQNNWADTNITRTAAAFIAPDSTQVGIQFTASAANATVISTAAVGSSLARTFSVWLKRISGTGVINYTLDNGTTWIAQAITSTVTRYTFTTTTANQQVGFQIVTAGDSIGIWGAQLEAGSFATSYIPTVASTVTRAADQASMTGTNFSSWYNQAQGSFYVDLDTLSSTVGNAYPYTIYSNSLSYVFAYIASSTNIRPIDTSTGGASPTITVTYLTSGYKLAGAYGNSKYGSVNGVSSSSSVTTTSVASSINIGSYSSNNGVLNGHIRKLSYYPVALSSSNLVALTS